MTGFLVCVAWIGIVCLVSFVGGLVGFCVGVGWDWFTGEEAA